MKPIKTNGDLKKHQQKDVNGVDFREEQLKDAAFPCGLVAKSFFTDTFTELKKIDDDEEFEINEEGIAWESDKSTSSRTLIRMTGKANSGKM